MRGLPGSVGSRGYKVVLNGLFTSALHPRSQKCLHFGGPLFPCYAFGIHAFSTVLIFNLPLMLNLPTLQDRRLAPGSLPKFSPFLPSSRAAHAVGPSKGLTLQ